MTVVMGGVILMMRFMPRLMAGVPFAEPKAVYALMDSGTELLVIDVRTNDEFTSPLGHIPGSINLAGIELDNRLKEADSALDSLKTVPVFVVCRTENRSPRAARVLKNNGFTNVAIVKGGMMNWSKQELPVEN